MTAAHLITWLALWLIGGAAVTLLWGAVVHVGANRPDVGELGHRAAAWLSLALLAALLLVLALEIAGACKWLP